MLQAGGVGQLRQHHPAVGYRVRGLPQDTGGTRGARQVYQVPAASGYWKDTRSSPGVSGTSCTAYTSYIKCEPVAGIRIRYNGDPDPDLQKFIKNKI